MTQNITISKITNPAGVSVTDVTQTEKTEFEKILDDDIDNAYLNNTEFAKSIKYFHEGLQEWHVYNVIFDDPHASVALGSGEEFNSLRPQFLVAQKDLETRIFKNDRCIISGTEYIVDDYVADGVGVMTVYLRLR
jgi:hypothetical protein